MAMKQAEKTMWMFLVVYAAGAFVFCAWLYVWGGG